MASKSLYRGADHFTKEAKKAGYPARSVFKLEEIDRRMHLFCPGMHVLDLGAAPGSWSLYIAQKIAPNGRLLAVDQKPLEIALPAHAEFVCANALSHQTDALALDAIYDVVVSDMAPPTTGNRIVDQARSVELFLRALSMAEAYVKPGGAFVGKIFMSEDLPKARADVRKIFQRERLIRPEGTRTKSYELFIVGLERKGQD